MLALHGVVHVVNSCHINITHNNVECTTQAYNVTFAKSVCSVTPLPNTATIHVPLVTQNV